MLVLVHSPHKVVGYTDIQRPFRIGQDVHVVSLVRSCGHGFWIPHCVRNDREGVFGMTKISGPFGRTEGLLGMNDRRGLFGVTECVQNNRNWPLSFRVKGEI